MLFGPWPFLLVSITKCAVATAVPMFAVYQACAAAAELPQTLNGLRTVGKYWLVQKL
jgi:hypothetical protein